MSAASVDDWDHQFTDEELAADQEPDDPRKIAAHYARTGLRVFPTHATSKQPMPGYRWKQRATADPKQAMLDTDDAIAEWGAENVSISWACGIDGHLAIDLDAPEAPPWWADLEAIAVVNHTRRGRHLVFKFPDGVTPGNGATRFPTSGWGEVRGEGGYIVIAGPDRPGLDVSQFPARPFPRPEWLSDAGETSDAATTAEVRAFIARHRGFKMQGRATPGTLPLVEAYLDGWDPGVKRRDGADGKAKHYETSRHVTATHVAYWVACDAAEGKLSAADGFKALRRWWQRVMEKDPDRRDGSELDDVIAWAVGQIPATAEPPPNIDPDTGEILEDDDQGDEGEDPLASLDPVDLGPALAGEREVIAPTILARDDGLGLFYVGQINGLHAKDGVGKSWVALFAAVEQLNAGRRVMWIDCEDPNEATIVERLIALGVAPEVIDSPSFHYSNPSVELTRPGAVARIISHIDERTTLVVVDSIGEAFSLDGVNENNDDEVGPWYRQVLRPLAVAGPAVLTIDHATNANNDPLRPSGSKRKRAAVTGQQLEVTATTPFSKDHGGRLRLTCAKDRHGNYRRGSVVADIVVRVDEGRIGFDVYAPASESSDAPLEVELAASAAFKALAEGGGGPMSQRELMSLMRERFTGSTETKRAGIERAVRQGRIVERAGPRNSRQFSVPPDDQNPTAPDRA